MMQSDALRRAEAILSEALMFGDTHDACVRALDIIREELARNEPSAGVLDAIRRLPGLSNTERSAGGSR